MENNKESVKEFLARGGKITVLPSMGEDKVITVQLKTGHRGIKITTEYCQVISPSRWYSDIKALRSALFNIR